METPTGDAPPGVGHVHRRLLVAGVDESEALVVHHVHDGQDVVSRQGEDVVDALQPEGLSYEVTTSNAGHVILRIIFF